MQILPQLINVGYVALSMLLGGLIGLEREIADKPAGLRTHMLVAGASTLVVSLGSSVLAHFLIPGVSDNISSDPTRIVQAIITGISFLGAGTIIIREKKETVEGLTTAASILFVAGIGISVGARNLTLAIGVTILALATLRLVHPIELAFRNKRAKKAATEDVAG